MQALSITGGLVKEIIDYLQLGANGIVLTVLGWLYFAYIRNLKSEAKLKDEQVKVSEKSMTFWKDKANELEKKSPEFIESVLSNRIEIREKELARLNEDAEFNAKEIEEKNRQLDMLHSELEKAKYFGRALTYYDSELDDEVIIPESDIELVELGEVFVDSGSLMLTDPCYVSSEWKNIPYEPLDKYKDLKSGDVYQFRKDFQRYDEILLPYEKKVNQLINEKTLVLIEEERELSYSFAGSAYATSSKLGFGVLPFENGALGAGFCIKTVYGDGGYRVLGEKYKGDIVRIYIDLQ